MRNSEVQARLDRAAADVEMIRRVVPAVHAAFVRYAPGAPVARPDAPHVRGGGGGSQVETRGAKLDDVLRRERDWHRRVEQLERLAGDTRRLAEAVLR